MKIKSGKFKLLSGENSANNNSRRYAPFAVRTLVGAMTELNRRNIQYNASFTKTKCGYTIDIKNGIVSFKKIP